MNAHNERYKDGLETFKMGVNHFSDLSTKEFEQMYLGTNVMINQTIDDELVYDVSYTSDDDRILWFKHQVQWYNSSVPVRNQGNCNACWA